MVNCLKFIENTIQESNAIISNLITRTDNSKSLLAVIQTNEHLHGLQMDIINNGNIPSNELNKGGLHFNPSGIGKVAINFIRKIKKFATTSQVTSGFQKASGFDSQINSRYFNNLGNN